MDSKEKICPFCEAIFGISEIKDHIGIEHLGLQSGDFIEKEEASQFQCEVCSTSFISEISLQRHVQFSHSKVEKNVEKTIDKEDSIAKTNPKKLGIGNPERKYTRLDKRLECPNCDKTFTRKHNLRNHIRTIHEGIKLDCPKCEKLFTRKEYLQSHIRTIHDGIKLDCPKCDKSFTRGPNLRAHVKRFHEGLKLKCSKCDKTFGYQNNFNNHLKTMHNVAYTFPYLNKELH